MLPVARESFPAVLAELDRVFSEQPLHGALAFLNARTRHRFTAVDRFTTAGDLRIARFDREDPELQLGFGKIAFDATAGCRDFSLDSAIARDAAPQDPASVVEVAHVAVPLRGEDGEPWGSLCHFDRRPRPFPLCELPLLQYAARRLEVVLVRRASELPAGSAPTPFTFTGRTPDPVRRAIESYREHWELARRVETARASTSRVAQDAERVRQASAALRAASASLRQERAELRAAVEECAVILHRQAAPPQHMVIAIKTMMQRHMPEALRPGSDLFADHLAEDALRWSIDAYYAEA